MALKDTLLLDTLIWDLVLDINGNIAKASQPYAPAQDAASAIRLFQGELWYDTTQGIPYWTQIFGVSPPPIQLMKSDFNNAARSVPGVVGSTCFLTMAGSAVPPVRTGVGIGQFAIGISPIGGSSGDNRTQLRRLGGQVQVVLENGLRAVAGF